MNPFCYIFSFILLFSAAAPSFGQKTNTLVTIGWIDELEAKLAGMGIDLDQENMSKSTLLAAVQTVDSHARNVTTQEWAVIQQQQAGIFFTPGTLLSITNGLPVVAELMPGSPAETAGLRTGDFITGIGSRRFGKIALPFALELLRSTNENPVTIEYRRNDITNIIEVSRKVLPEPAIELAELLPNNIGYIKINGLYPGSGRDIVSRIRAWTEMARDGIIIDLRGAGGADYSSTMQTAALFSLSGQFLFAFRDFKHQDISVFNAPEGNPISLPVMVLIDRHTSGASEVLAATLNGSARNVLLIGETTAGDFSLREAVPLSNQLVYMATKVLNTADGIRYNGQFGLEPSVEIHEHDRDTRDYEPPVDLLDHRQVLEVEGRDMAARRRVRGDGTLERAIDIVIGLKSLNNVASGVSSPESF